MVLDNGEPARDGLFDPDAPPNQLDKFGNYNNKIRAWPEAGPEPPRPAVEYNDYNRKMKGWSETSSQQHQQQHRQQHHTQPISVTTEDVRVRRGNAGPGHTVTTVRTSRQVNSLPTNSSYSLPRGFGSSKAFKQQLISHSEL